MHGGKKTEEQNMNITKETERWKLFAYQPERGKYLDKKIQPQRYAR